MLAVRSQESQSCVVTREQVLGTAVGTRPSPTTAGHTDGMPPIYALQNKPGVIDSSRCCSSGWHHTVGATRLSKQYPTWRISGRSQCWLSGRKSRNLAYSPENKCLAQQWARVPVQPQQATRTACRRYTPC